MALQQAGVDAKLCESLHGDLRDWIGYILSSKVKLGKTKPRNSMKYVMDVSPSDIVAEKLVSGSTAHGVESGVMCLVLFVLFLALV
jgi:hypothetical protein